MFEQLLHCPHCGRFTFKRNDDLKAVCNAPTDRSGVYLVWTLLDGERCLLYIGRSGKKVNGVVVHRKAGLGGMKDRLVNGYQFGKLARRQSWPMVMDQLDIHELEVEWYDTGDEDPVAVEHSLLREVKSVSGELPPWNSIL